MAACIPPAGAAEVILAGILTVLAAPLAVSAPVAADKAKLIIFSVDKAGGWMSRDHVVGLQEHIYKDICF